MCPTIDDFWSEERETVIQMLANKNLVLCGDGRNDSPGHSAQYCLYTLMDTETKKIADIQVVDKRETGLKSAAMEKLGLQRGLHALAGTVNICELATDASTSIMAMLG